MTDFVANVENRLPTGGEFQGYNGDCAVYAFMVARAAEDTARPCDGAELDRLTAESIQAVPPEAGPAGQMTDANLAWLAHQEGVPLSQVGFSSGALDAALQAHPVTVGFAKGEMLPGNEQNVFGHCVTFLAGDAASGYAVANGDSVNGRNGRLDLNVPLSVVESAEPTTISILEGDNMANPYLGFFKQVSPTDLECTENGTHIVLGMLTFWMSENGRAGLPLESERDHVYSAHPEVAEQAFERGALRYDPNHVIDSPPGAGSVYYAHIGSAFANIYGPLFAAADEAAEKEPPPTPIIDVAGIAADLNTATAALNSVDSAITDAHKKLGA